jgi:hypothetical protein
VPDDLSELEDEVMRRLARVDLTNSGTGTQTYIWDMVEHPRVDITNHDTATLHYAWPADWDMWGEPEPAPEPEYEEPQLTGHPYRGTLVAPTVRPTLGDRVLASWDAARFWLRGLVY